MAQPTNTYDSYDQVGIREDLSNVIYDISPTETPFYSGIKKGTAKNTFCEWQTDALRASAANAHIEGDDTVATARTPTTRLGNYTQIFKDAVVTSGTDEGLDKAGRAKEMAYQVMKVAKEQKLDIEKALLDNNARVAGSSSVARELAGVPAWIVTNQSIGATGAAPTGDGTDARTDGTQTAFTQARLDAVIQSAWTNGGKPDTVLLAPFQLNLALGFTGNNNQRATIDATKSRVENTIEVYATPFGTVKLIPSRECRARDVFVLDMGMWSAPVLRATRNEELAKTGDNEKRQVITELTLACHNEKSSGIVADNTTS